MTPYQIAAGLLSAALATLGFAILFRVRKRHLFAASFGGLLVYAVYLLVMEIWGGEFTSCLVGAFTAAIYCEGCARVLRAPVQIYMIPILIPLFPGGSLYYSMYYLLLKSFDRSFEYLLLTLETGLGLAGGTILGIAVAEAFITLFRKLRMKRKGDGVSRENRMP